MGTEHKTEKSAKTVHARANLCVYVCVGTNILTTVICSKIIDNMMWREVAIFSTMHV